MSDVKRRLTNLERGASAEDRQQKYPGQYLWNCDALDEIYLGFDKVVLTGRELSERLEREEADPLVHMSGYAYMPLWPFGDGTDCEPDRAAYWERRMAHRDEHVNGRTSGQRHRNDAVEGCPDCAQMRHWEAYHTHWTTPPDDWPGWELEREAFDARKTRRLDWMLDAIAAKVRTGEAPMPEAEEGNEVAQLLWAELERRL